MRIRIQFSLLIIIVLLGIQCNAPRNNPLDPLNPDYSYGTIEGSVLTISPSFGIFGVNILWDNTNLNTQTDVNGRFRLRNIPIENGNIVFSKAGYQADTFYVAWGSAKRFFTLTYFNRIPTLDTVSIYTVIENQIPQPKASLFVKAWITDLDEDVDSVFVINENLNLRKLLLFSPTESNYQVSVPESELNVNDIEQTIGLDFSIMAKDASNEFIIGSDRVTRVIKEEVTGLHPSTDSTVNFNAQPIIFNWNRFDAGYDFSYMIEVYSYTIFTAPQLVYSQQNISSNSISFTITPILSIGDYYWTIWIVDQFQNRSRSKPSVFQVDTLGGNFHIR